MFNILTMVFLLVLLGALATLAVSWWRRRYLKPFALETSHLTVGPWTWRYHRSGRGPAMILIHGIGANLYCWQRLVPLLIGRFQLIAIDLPGFGGSSKSPHEHYGLDEQCQRLLDFMDALGIQEAHIVGNSMGGNIALWLARTSPERVLSVTVIAPAANPRLMPIKISRLAWASGPLSLVLSRPAIRWAHRRTVSRKELVDGTRVEETLKTYARNPKAVRSFLRASEAIRDPRLPHELSKIKDPVLLLWGERDLLVSKSTIDGLERALRKAFRHVHKTGGHHLQEDEPEWVAEKIVEFISQNQD